MWQRGNLIWSDSRKRFPSGSDRPSQRAGDQPVPRLSAAVTLFLWVSAAIGSPAWIWSSPDRIRAALSPATQDGAARPKIEPDRRAAINYALANAAEDDVVIIAGKGHETTQEIAGVKHPFDDRQVVREFAGA